MSDVFDTFKANQRVAWSTFTPTQAFTTPTAAQLVKHAQIKAGQHVLDVGCGTGVVAVTAARLGAVVTGLDLTPELIAVARENSALAQVSIEWHEGDVEKLPFADATFDVVVSQFGHMFAPRPDVAIGEMLRVLKSGGTIAFSTWPPELYVGRMFALNGKYAPPPPPGVMPPPLWGDPNIVRERLGSRVTQIEFDRRIMLVPALSPEHQRDFMERNVGPMTKLVENLTANDPGRLAEYRAEMDALAAEFHEDNLLYQGYLMTRATKI